MAQRQVRDTIQDRFPDASRLGQLEIDYNATPIRIRAVVLTPRLDSQADRALADDLRRRLKRPVDLHVDQLQVDPDASGVETAQIARASTSTGEAERQQQRTVTDLALMVGAEPSAIAVDAETRTLSATAAPLPELGMAGYRALEARAAARLMPWAVRLAPPADVPLPSIAVDAGVVDVGALDTAAWGSSRLGRALLVDGGSLAQRRAVADGIKARGSSATPNAAGGAIRLSWQE